MEKTITITVTLKGWIEKYFEDCNTKSIQVPEGSVAIDIMEIISLPTRFIGVISINGVNASKYQQLQDGDCISFYPMVEGG